MRRLLPIFLALSISLIGCDKTEVPKAETDSPTESVSPGDKAESEDESPHEEHEHAEHTEGVHLGAHMYELSRRFAAVWYAGKAGNEGMVDYQLHEMEEVIEELEETRPEEAGVDVVARLNSDVKSHFETLEEAAEAGDQEKFEETYQLMMGKCTTCHADTKHPFIQVKKPEYNPYPNLAF